jgi:DNA-binding HxlR family transcriptional regulator
MPASAAPAAAVKRSRSTKPAPLPQCPVEKAINLIGGKWKLLVLRSLLLNGPQRYNELQISVGGISAKELTRNLRALDDAGLVARRLARNAPYVLTPLGVGLMPVFKRLLPWGRRLIRTAASR